MNTELNISDVDPNAIHESLEDIKGNMEMFTDLVRDKLSPQRHMIIVSVITQEVHNREITSKLIEEGISDPKEFLWQQ